jgi:hypothetical protein
MLKICFIVFYLPQSVLLLQMANIRFTALAILMYPNTDRTGWEE